MAINLEYNHHLPWLQGFRGVMLERLEAVTFHSESEQIGDFLKAFKSILLCVHPEHTLGTLVVAHEDGICNYTLESIVVKDKGVRATLRPTVLPGRTLVDL